MPSFKSLVLFSGVALGVAMMPLASQAADEQKMVRQLLEARQEGAIWMAFELNRQLNPFALESKVEEGRATLSGTVESDVLKDLAEQVALSVAGIESVDNRIRVDAATDVGGTPGLAQRVDDATLDATVRSRLLWSSNTRDLDIKVRSEGGDVTLSGQAVTPAAKELAGELADNTDGVRAVYNHLSVSRADSSEHEVQTALDEAREDISDEWITDKVKASLLVSRNLDGLNIQVATEDGLVRLRGNVLSHAEKRLASEIAWNIRGVRGVDADALLVRG